MISIELNTPDAKSTKIIIFAHDHYRFKYTKCEVQQMHVHDLALTEAKTYLNDYPCTIFDMLPVRCAIELRFCSFCELNYTAHHRKDTTTIC